MRENFSREGAYGAERDFGEDGSAKLVEGGGSGSGDAVADEDGGRGSESGEEVRVCGSEG